jgi:acetyl-CoA carboxylase biotin carboxyl carrier protein
VSELIALLAGDEVRAPAPGWFQLGMVADHLVVPGDRIGELHVLGRVYHLVAPAVRGLVQLPPGPPLARRAVGYGDLLFRVSAELAAFAPEAAASAVSAVERADLGLVFRAPTSGRFYGRPAPDKPAFVTAGAELTAGTTICLLEVMKTFHRVTYGGPDVPPRARVKELLVADGDDVNAGDPLLALEPV